MSEKNEGFSMIVPVMAISNLVLTRQIYSEETNGAHAHYREPVPSNFRRSLSSYLKEQYPLLRMHQTLIFGEDVAKSKDARRVREP